jgi:hypothetical protein
MHLIETMHAGSGLLGYALDFSQAEGVPGRINGQFGLDRGEKNCFLF